MLGRDDMEQLQPLPNGHSELLKTEEDSIEREKNEKVKELSDSDLDSEELSNESAKEKKEQSNTIFKLGLEDAQSDQQRNLLIQLKQSSSQDRPLNLFAPSQRQEVNDQLESQGESEQLMDQNMRESFQPRKAMKRQQTLRQQGSRIPESSSTPRQRQKPSILLQRNLTFAIQEKNQKIVNEDDKDSNEISLTESQKAIIIEQLEEEKRQKAESVEQELVAKFYAREGDRFSDKIFIYFIVFTFDVAMKVFAAFQFMENGMGKYLAAQLVFLILERLAKVALFSSLGIYRLVFLNFFFLDYLAMRRYLELRKTLRNYNLYSVIVKRIDVLIASKVIEATLLSGPSALITLYASINGLGDRINSFYVFSIASSLATLILANLEMLDFQLVQCKFNSLSNKLRESFEQDYKHQARDLVVILINILAQAGFWMICSQQSYFVIIHAWLTYCYILVVVLVVLFKSISLEVHKDKSGIDKAAVEMRAVATTVAVCIGAFLFLLIYCMFFFLRTKKRLFLYLLQNTEKENNRLQENIVFIKKQFERVREMEEPKLKNLEEDSSFQQFLLFFQTITFFRVYCIFNIIGLVLCDALLNDSTTYVAARVVSYSCSIIVFFHLFQLKRDLDLFLKIRNERMLRTHFEKLLTELRITIGQFEKFKQELVEREDQRNSPEAEIQQNRSGLRVLKQSKGFELEDIKIELRRA